jgi:NAD(P)-dependent dehydrogenase (short-subunit alcohol dehydrogenase family)
VPAAGADRLARLAGRRAVVTGAARGIGRAIAERLAAEGAAVVVADVLEEEGARVAAAIGATFRRLDVTSEEQWSALAGELRGEPPAVLINNAGGLLSSAQLHDHAVDAWRSTIDLNLTSVFLGMRALIPLMRDRGGGAIVNLCSFSGLVGQPDAPAYQAAKAGVWLLTRNAAVTYGAERIRVNAISPSVIDTPALRTDHDARTASFLRRVPLARPGTPEEVAGAAAYLASDEAAYVTGANLPVDGGYLA